MTASATSPAALEALALRVERGSGSDRALDADVMVALGPVHDAGLLLLWSHEAPHYTTSLDAFVALIEEKLPGWAYRVERVPESLFHCSVWRRGELIQLVTHPSPARALLAAFLRAKASEAAPHPAEETR